MNTFSPQQVKEAIASAGFAESTATKIVSKLEEEHKLDEDVQKNLKKIFKPKR